MRPDLNIFATHRVPRGWAIIAPIKRSLHAGLLVRSRARWLRGVLCAWRGEP
jgi:hypothetical protein